MKLLALESRCLLMALVGAFSCQTTGKHATREVERDTSGDALEREFHFSAGELDDVPDWAREAKSLCLVGHAESCETVARGESQAQLEARWLEDQKERECRAKHTTRNGVYEGPKGSCLGGWSIAREISDPKNETAAQREERRRRERERQRRDAYQERWYGRAISAKLRTCKLARSADAKAECDAEGLDALVQISDIDPVAEVAALEAFEQEMTKQRASMKEACKKGEPEQCWRWSLTDDVDGDSSQKNSYTLLLQAVAAGSPRAWGALAGLVNGYEHPLPALETREKILKEHDRFKKGDKQKSEIFMQHHFQDYYDIASPESSYKSRKTIHLACAREHDMGACYYNKNFDQIHRYDRPKREKKARDLHQQAMEHCSSKEEGRSCWVAGYTIEFMASDPDSAKDAYEQGCELGSPRACYGLGRALMRGGDMTRAAASFEEACALEYKPGCVMLGAHHVMDNGVSRDVKLARRHLEAACDESADRSPAQSACFLLGLLP
jgi:hypothetical protein